MHRSNVSPSPGAALLAPRVAQHRDPGSQPIAAEPQKLKVSPSPAPASPPPSSTALALSLTYGNNPIRMAGTRERPEWIAADVATILGIKNIRQTVATFDDDEAGVCTAYTSSGPGVRTTDTLGRPDVSNTHTRPAAHTMGGSPQRRQMLTVTEPGLYRLIFQSRKSEAKAFRRWVFHEVSPSIRAHGSYPPPSAQERRRAAMDACTGMAATMNRRLALPGLAFDPTIEEPLTLTNAAKLPFFPARRNEKRPTMQTLLRWSQVGIKGVVLETVRIGETLCTSRPALLRFMERCSNPRVPKTGRDRATARQRPRQDLPDRRRLLACDLSRKNRPTIFY